MADRVKEVAREEADRLKGLTIEAARSAAYLYPLRVRPPRSDRLLYVTRSQCCNDSS